MLEPYRGKIGEIAVLHAHTGAERDRGNRVYSVAAAVLSPGNRVARFESHVRYERFTARDRLASNLSREIVRNAPAVEVAAGRLHDFLGKRDFIFTLNSPETIPDLREFSGICRIVDLGFAAEFFLPGLGVYTPLRLSEYLYAKPRDRVRFPAAETVSLSVDLLRFIGESVLNDQRDPRARVLRYFLEKSDTLFGAAMCSIGRNFRECFGGLFSPCVLPDTGEWRKFLTRAEPPPPFDSLDAPVRETPREDLESRFHDLAGAGKGMRFRPSQVDFAVSVAEAFNRGAHLCIEAGTGTGKTQGYLIPAFEFLRRNPLARIAVSTYTKSLQEQIHRRETVLSQEVFQIYRDIPVSVLKGKSSYLCVEKLDDLFEEDSSGERLLSWLYCLNLVFNHPHADGDAIGERIRRHLDRRFHLTHTFRAASSREGCGPGHHFCPARIAAAEAKRARLVVTNHHKLARLEKDPAFAGLFKRYIIDEANHFEEAVRAAHRVEIDTAEILRTVGQLESHLRNQIKTAGGDFRRFLSEAIEGSGALRPMTASLCAFLAAATPDGEPKAERILPVLPDGKRVPDLLRVIRKAILRIEKGVSGFLDLLSEGGKPPDRAAGKIRTELSLLLLFGESLNRIAESAGEENSYLFFSLSNGNAVVGSAPVELADIIRDEIYAGKESIVFTAATLCREERFEAFKELVGLDRPLRSGPDETAEKEIAFQRFDSPFSPDAMEVVVPEEAVNGKFGNKSAWLDRIVHLLPDLIRRNRGRTLVLFSSYSDLVRVAEKISGEIGEEYPLLIQKPGIPTLSLCEEFRSVHESVLFGVDTFWYGVDFKGETLTQVVITRIPFPSPKDPLQLARKSLLPPDRYWSRYMYDTEIKLRQGIGRLIRSDTDRGKVVILDSRYRRLKSP